MTIGPWNIVYEDVYLFFLYIPDCSSKYKKNIEKISKI